MPLAVDRAVQGHIRPLQHAVAVVVERDDGPIELVVEVVLGLELGDRLQLELVAHGSHGTAGRLARVVPPLESDDEDGPLTECRAVRHPSRIGRPP